MSNKSDEILSAFMDEETTAFESRRCVNDLLSDKIMRSRWERYHIAREALHGNLPVAMDQIFSRSVMQRIQEQMAQGKPERVQSFRFLKPVGGIAIAASVAALTLFGVRSLINTKPAITPVEVAEVQPNDQRQIVNLDHVAPPRGWYVDPRARARMNSYLVNHAEYAARKGVMPYARIVGYDMSH
ncbi:MAG: sigma-E factor negative regulatory protein [Pseudomonadota bacterium]